MPALAGDLELFHALVLLNLLFVTGGWCLACPSYRAGAAVVCLSAAWLFWNGPLEGRILISFSIEHGFTESDILAIIGFIVAAATFIRTHERRRHEER